MKICWDNLENLRYKKEEGIWVNKKYKYKFVDSCKICGESFLSMFGTKGEFCSKDCAKYKKTSLETRQKISKTRKGKKLSLETRQKISKAKKGKKLSTKRTDTYKEKIRKSLTGRKLSTKTKEKISQGRTGKSLGKNHPNWKGGYNKKGVPTFDTYAPQIDWCESVRRDPEDPNILNVKCEYCGKWYRPTTNSLCNRLGTLAGNMSGESRFYCSKECKCSCPVFRQQKFPKGFRPTKSRDDVLQKEWSDLIKIRDDYKCVKCGATEELVAHHLEGIRWEPLESADLDIGVTLCKKCHEKVHHKEGCSYLDMKCSNDRR
jgi:hypothetical protein